MADNYSNDPCTALYSTESERVTCRKDSRVLTRQVAAAQAAADRKAARKAAAAQAAADRKAARKAAAAQAKADRIHARKAARNAHYAAQNYQPGVDGPWQNS